MEDNDLEQAMKSWLSDEVKKYCNADGMIETYWDYDDRSALKDSIKNYMDDYEGGNLTEYIADQMREENWWLNWCDEYEDDFYAGIHNDIETIKDEALKSYVADKIGDMDYTDLHDLLEEVGYNGIDDGIEEELRNLKLNVNLTLATDDEANYDMSSIITCFGTDYLQVEFDSLDAQHLDNALTYLVHQQGHTLKELYDAMLGGKEAGTFIKSVVEEIENDPAEATCGLTVLVSVGTDEYSAIISRDGNIEVSADTELGLYNSWIGGGSVLGIDLEKPFVFPASMVLHADFDDVTGSGNYSVGDCYGTMGEDRKGTVTRGGEASVQSEDLDAVADYVRATYDNGEEVEESKKITESDGLKRYNVVLTLDGDARELYSPMATNKKEAKQKALEMAKKDLYVVYTEKEDDGYFVAVYMKEHNGSKEYTIQADSEEEAREKALHQAYLDIKVVYNNEENKKLDEDLIDMGDLRDSIDTENLISSVWYRVILEDGCIDYADKNEAIEEAESRVDALEVCKVEIDEETGDADYLEKIWER